MIKMKRIVSVLLILISGLFILTGCQAETEDGPAVLKVKGLYVGMNIDDACKIVNSLFGSSYIVRDVPPTFQATGLLPGTYMVDMTDDEIKGYLDPKGEGNGRLQLMGFRGDSYIPIFVTADANRKVIYIRITSSAVDKLFNVTDIEAEDFSKEFINSYKIPYLKPVSFDWEFSSPYGYRLKISSNKTIEIQEISKKSNFKFD